MKHLERNNNNDIPATHEQREQVKVGAILVLYNPNLDLLQQCVDTLEQQVDEVCVVDNSTSSHSSFFCAYKQKVCYIANMKNVGIAAAQNIGIEHFKRLQFHFVLFSDQDSLSPQGLVQGLLTAYQHLSPIIPIACIGPMPINRTNGKPYFCPQNVLKTGQHEGVTYHQVHSIISSYSFIPLKNFEVVGNMREQLFIDFVDDDWCWRALTYHQMVSVLVPNIRIEHELGVSSTFMGRNISLSSPFRMYYQTRNLLWMCRQPYTPTYWKRMNLKKLLIKFVYYPLFTHQRWAYLKRMVQGVIDGLRTSLN